MPYFANFQKHAGHQFRLDTRIYLRQTDAPGRGDRCVAAIIGKNPGSANPTQFNRLIRLSLDGDQLLPYVRNRFLAAYQRSGSAIPHGAYVRVWNLMYLCNPHLKEAIAVWAAVPSPLICDTEDTLPAIVWFAWGPPHPKLQPFTSRFIDRGVESPFYYDMTTQQVVARQPEPTSRVKHPQGLRAEPIEQHLAQLVGRGSR